MMQQISEVKFVSHKTRQVEYQCGNLTFWNVSKDIAYDKMSEKRQFYSSGNITFTLAIFLLSILSVLWLSND